MIINKMAIFTEPDMCMDAEVTDYLPRTITIHLNGSEHTFYGKERIEALNKEIGYLMGKIMDLKGDGKYGM